MHPATGVRHELDPAEWTREGLILDVRNGDLFEGHCIEHVRRSSNGELIEGRNTGAVVGHHAASGQATPTKEDTRARL